MRLARSVCVLLLVIFVAATANSQTQKADSGPPLKVVAAQVPFYPINAQLIGIQGQVRLHVSMKGKQVTEVHIDAGEPMLAKAAEENVKTWQFREHAPASFEVTFVYKLLPDAACFMDSGNIVLQLPTEVRVTASEIMTCDPNLESGVSPASEQ